MKSSKYREWLSLNSIIHLKTDPPEGVQRHKPPPTQIPQTGALTLTGGEETRGLPYTRTSLIPRPPHGPHLVFSGPVCLSWKSFIYSPLSGRQPPSPSSMKMVYELSNMPPLCFRCPVFIPWDALVHILKLIHLYTFSPVNLPVASLFHRPSYRIRVGRGTSFHPWEPEFPVPSPGN